MRDSGISSSSIAQPDYRVRGITWIFPLAVALLTVLAFLPSLWNGFVTWDDDKNFLNNPHYRGLGPSQLSWMWTTFRLGHYVPLSWMTLGVDYELWGMNARGYHLTSLIIHVANAVTLWFLARTLLRMSMSATLNARRIDIAAAFAALVFAIHPLRVESVAWVTERRDVLSLFFCLLSLASYLRHAQRPRFAGRWYVAAVVLFACALLSKATVMTFPAVLLVLNIYPLRRFAPSNPLATSARRVYIELAAFTVLSATSVALSLIALEPPPQLPLGGKIAVSAYSLAFYGLKTLAPLRLSPLYQMPQSIPPFALQYVASYAFVIALAVIAWLSRRKHPGITTALAVFTVVSLPMLGVVQNGPQIAADRYTYHAAPALAILAGAVLLSVTRRSSAYAISAAVLVTLGALTWRQSYVWRDSDALWTQALAVDSTSSIAHSSRARILLAQNRVDDAYAHGARAVALAPGDAEAHNALGVALARQGQFAEAVGEYQKSLALAPRYSDEPYNNWGVVRAQQGDLDGAIAQYEAALKVNPDNADAQVNWGNALVRLDRPDDAVGHYAAALEIRPDHADAHLNWGVALARQSKFAAAIKHFRGALAIDPAHVEARQYLEQATRLLPSR